MLTNQKIIEKAAKAIYANNNQGSLWKREPQYVRDSHMSDAKAALEAAGFENLVEACIVIKKRMRDQDADAEEDVNFQQLRDALEKSNPTG